MKTRTRRIISLLAAAMMCASLAACGTKQPTAEELIESGSPDGKVMEAEFELAMDADMSYEGLTMAMSIDMVGNVESDGTTTHMDGYVNASVLGMSTKVEQDTYAQTEGGELTTYSYDAETGIWTYEISDADEGTGLFSIADYDLTDIELKETEKGDTEYTVTAKAASDMLSTIDMSSLVGAENSNGMELDITMTFDKETGYVTSVLMESEGQSGEDISITSLKFSLTDIEWTDGTVTIPSSVIRDSVPAEDSASYVEDYTGISDDSYVTYPDYADGEAQEETEEEEASLESEEGAASASESGSQYADLGDVRLLVSTQEQSYGGTYVYILAVNGSEESKAVNVELSLMSNGSETETVTRYLEMEAGCFNVAYAYTTNSFDEIAINASNQAIYHEYLGSECDIDYEIDSETGECTGTVTNSTGETLSYPEVKFVALNSDSEVVSVASAYVEASELADGESSTFTMWIDTDIQYYDVDTACFFAIGTVK